MIIHDYMNDGTGVSMWQDVVVDDDKDQVEPGRVPGDVRGHWGRGHEGEDAVAGGDSDAPIALRAVDDVESLRAMADPTRLSILDALMQPRHGELPVMSAKELAAQLREPQTKLYRHIRQLEAAGLIRVAATRMVSGILEQRYQACQRDITFAGAFLRQHGTESAAILQAVFNRFRDGLFASFEENALEADLQHPEEPSKDYRRPKFYTNTDLRVSPAKAEQAKARLQEFIDWLAEEEAEGPDSVMMNVLIGYYSIPDR
jgi:DNA-binding transcriptional ArsR family regulator